MKKKFVKFSNLYIHYTLKMNEEKNSDIHLRPRFKIEIDEDYEALLNKFKTNLKEEGCKYLSKVVDGHIVINIPKDESHFWSPQLNIEIEKVENNKSLVKGLFGPKPQVWTFFMFVHFGVAVTFIGFLILWYVRWSLGENVVLPMAMTIFLPLFWILLYFLGRIGKDTGRKQIVELHDFLMKMLNA